MAGQAPAAPVAAGTVSKRFMTRVSAGIAMAAAAAACLILGGCTSARPRLDMSPWVAATADMARADGLVRAGCYGCLAQALSVYERLGAPPADLAAARGKAVDTAILLAIRERELGLGAGRWRARAEDLARALPPPRDVAEFFAIVDAVGWRSAGVSAEQQDTILAVQPIVSAQFANWRASLLPGAPRDLLSAYALLTLDCLYSYRLSLLKQAAWPLPAGAPPLLRYREAICPGGAPDAIAALAADEPRFSELQLWLGEIALGRGTLRTAERHFLAAVADIPELMAAKYRLGVVAFQMEDIEAAQVHFHDVVKAVPGQRDAMLGEAKTLGYLGRQDAAIAVLDEMVRLGTWYIGDAHYWLAWNRHRLKQYDVADDEIVMARRALPMDPNVDKLAGLVALARNDTPRAELEFRRAVQHYEDRQIRDCDAGYYLASVLVSQRMWAEGAERFVLAVPCYAADEQAARSRIAEIRAADLTEDRKARLITAKEKQVASAQAQQARAAYNGAVAYANLGDKDRARPLAEQASRYPDLADLAQKLLARLKAGQARLAGRPTS